MYGVNFYLQNIGVEDQIVLPPLKVSSCTSSLKFSIFLKNHSTRHTILELGMTHSWGIGILDLSCHICMCVRERERRRQLTSNFIIKICTRKFVTTIYSKLMNFNISFLLIEPKRYVFCVWSSPSHHTYFGYVAPNYQANLDAWKMISGYGYEMSSL